MTTIVRKSNNVAISPKGRRVVGAYLTPLLETARERGVTPRQLAEFCALPSACLEPLPESLAAQDYTRVLAAGAELAQDPNFGLHVGEHVKLGTYNVYGLILLSCRDFGQVLQQTIRFEGLAHDLGRSDLSVQNGLAEYCWTSHMEKASRHLAESVFAGIRVFGNWLAGAPLPPARVSFCHEAPADCSEHLRIFGEPVVFGARQNTARFDAAFLNWPVPNADVSLYPVLQQHAEQLLREKARAEADGGMVAKVRASIIRNLALDQIRIAQIAEDLHVTQRTLQRKLQEAGVTYQMLLDRTRHELAEDYLQQGQLSIAEIAFLLGFQEQSSFNHAFKEWTGLNPGAYRGKPAGKSSRT